MTFWKGKYMNFLLLIDYEEVMRGSWLVRHYNNSNNNNHHHHHQHLAKKYCIARILACSNIEREREIRVGADPAAPMHLGRTNGPFVHRF
jgi:hypothetical protein